MGISKIVFLFLDKNIRCGYSLEAPQRGASNEYPQHMISSRNKKNIDTFWVKKAPYQDLCKCPKISYTKVADKIAYANSADPDQCLHCLSFH